MNQKGFALNYLVISLVILTFVGGAYYFGKTSNKTITSFQQQITPTVSVDETSNWKTYTSGRWSIKYPPNFVSANVAMDPI